MIRNRFSFIKGSSALPKHTAMLLSPWLIVGCAVILGLAITFWAVKNTRQERENMAITLQERSDALMWAVEGSARAGMGMQRTAPYIQFMLEELSKQNDIVYIAIVSGDGTIISHSDPARIGTTLYPPEGMEGIAPFPRVQSRIVKIRQGERIFEAYRRFAPLLGFRQHMSHGGGHGGMGHDMSQYPNPFAPDMPNMRMMRGKGRMGRMERPPAASEAPRNSVGDIENSPSLPKQQGQPGIGASDGAAPNSGENNFNRGTSGSEAFPSMNPIFPNPFVPKQPFAENGQFRRPAGQIPELIIIVGLDIESVEKTLTTGEKNTLFTAILVGLIGMGGLISLFWAQNYKISRRMLLDTRAFADEVIKNLPIGLIILDANQKVADINPVAERLLGIKAASVIALPPSGLPGTDWDKIAARAALAQNALEEEHVLHCSGQAASSQPHCPDNGIPVSISASRIMNEKDESLGLIYLIRDLREVTRLQEELRRSERLSTLGNMAARVAHEIRNPLSSIKGFATYLGSRQSDPSDQEATRTMIGEVDRLNRVVSELLDFARPSNLQISPAGLGDILERAVRLARIDASTKGVAISLPDTADAVIAVDPERITQAILNLLLNAIQATKQGGSVTVHTPPPQNGYAFISITDTGCGMDEKTLAQVFTPYFTTRATGTGLGLSIVSKIIEDHQGEISMLSTPGEGTTVSIRLPLAQK